jgi:hypothetical protein
MLDVLNLALLSGTTAKRPLELNNPDIPDRDTCATVTVFGLAMLPGPLVFR